VLLDFEPEVDCGIDYKLLKVGVLIITYAFPDGFHFQLRVEIIRENDIL
jgi:hypothetical protein